MKNLINKLKNLVGGMNGRPRLQPVPVRVRIH